MSGTGYVLPTFEFRVPPELATAGTDGQDGASDIASGSIR